MTKPVVLWKNCLRNRTCQQWELLNFLKIVGLLSLIIRIKTCLTCFQSFQTWRGLPEQGLSLNCNGFVNFIQWLNLGLNQFQNLLNTNLFSSFLLNFHWLLRPHNTFFDLTLDSEITRKAKIIKNFISSWTGNLLLLTRDLFLDSLWWIWLTIICNAWPETAILKSRYFRTPQFTTPLLRLKL